MITTINFHLIKACNFRCKFCYATFEDIKGKSISKNEQMELMRQLAKSKLFKKINFAGGEPTLVPHIDELIIHAKILGFETSIVTNASRIDENWIKRMAPYLDILTISLDSLDEGTNLISGRADSSGNTIKREAIESLANACHDNNIALKINTVVSRFNLSETLSPFINIVKPFRWKVLQVTRIEGQNEKRFDELKVSDIEFQEFCDRNLTHLEHRIKAIVESEETIQGSYLMIDQLGRFYDSQNREHNYSGKILEIGVEQALSQVNVDGNKFLRRSGNYNALSEKLSSLNFIERIPSVIALYFKVLKLSLSKITRNSAKAKVGSLPNLFQMLTSKLFRP